MIPEYVDKNSEEKGHKFIVKCCMNALDEIRKGFFATCSAKNDTNEKYFCIQPSLDS